MYHSSIFILCCTNKCSFFNLMHTVFFPWFYKWQIHLCTQNLLPFFSQGKVLCKDGSAFISSKDINKIWTRNVPVWLRSSVVKSKSEKLKKTWYCFGFLPRRPCLKLFLSTSIFISMDINLLLYLLYSHKVQAISFLYKRGIVVNINYIFSHPMTKMNSKALFLPHNLEADSTLHDFHYRTVWGSKLLSV